MASVPTGGYDRGVRRPPSGQAGGGGGQRHQAPRTHLLRAPVRRAPENRTRARPQVLQETSEARGLCGQGARDWGPAAACAGRGLCPCCPHTLVHVTLSLLCKSLLPSVPSLGPWDCSPGSSGGGTRGQQSCAFQWCLPGAHIWPAAAQGPSAPWPVPHWALLTAAGASGLGGAGEDTWGSGDTRGPVSTGVTSVWSVRAQGPWGSAQGTTGGVGGPRKSLEKAPWSPGGRCVGPWALQCTQEVNTCAQMVPPPACSGRGSQVARGSPRPGGHCCDPVAQAR